jgi:hypothetical protein
VVEAALGSGRLTIESACRKPESGARASGYSIDEVMLATLPSGRPNRPLAVIWRSDTFFGFGIGTALRGQSSQGGRPQFALPLSADDSEGLCTASFDRGVVTLQWKAPGASRTATIRLGLLEGWLVWRTVKYVTPSVLLRARVTAAIALGLGIGILSGMLVAGRLRAVLFAAGVGVLLVLAVDGLLLPGVALRGAVLVGAVAAIGAAVAGTESGSPDLPAVVLRPGR